MTHHIQVKTCTFLLKCLHVMDENVTHPIPCPEFSPTSSHMHMFECENQTAILFHQWPFFKTKAFCFINQNPLDGSRYQLAFPKFRVFMHLWVTDFLVYIVGRRTFFQHFYGLSPPMIMSNRKCRVFHPLCVCVCGGGGGGGSTPTHIFFNFYFKP